MPQLCIAGGGAERCLCQQCHPCLQKERCHMAVHLPRMRCKLLHLQQAEKPKRQEPRSNPTTASSAISVQQQQGARGALWYPAPSPGCSSLLVSRLRWAMALSCHRIMACGGAARCTSFVVARDSDTHMTHEGYVEQAGQQLVGSRREREEAAQENNYASDNGTSQLTSTHLRGMPMQGSAAHLVAGKHVPQRRKQLPSRVHTRATEKAVNGNRQSKRRLRVRRRASHQKTCAPGSWPVCPTAPPAAA